MKWTEEEDAVLFEHYARLGARGCAPMLRGRSKSSINKRARIVFGKPKAAKNPDEVACNAALAAWRSAAPANEPLRWRVA